MCPTLSLRCNSFFTPSVYRIRCTRSAQTVSLLFSVLIHFFSSSLQCNFVLFTSLMSDIHLGAPPHISLLPHVSLPPHVSHASKMQAKLCTVGNRGCIISSAPPHHFKCTSTCSSAAQNAPAVQSRFTKLPVGSVTSCTMHLHRRCIARCTMHHAPSFVFVHLCASHPVCKE